MTDIDGISDRIPRHKKKPTYDRFLPREGCQVVRQSEEVTYKLQYLDVNDVPEILQNSMNEIIKNEPDENVRNNTHIKVGDQFERKFRIFVFKDWNVVMSVTLIEILDNPHGYGRGDFLQQRYVFPEYRQSKFVRWAVSDITYFAFNSGLVEKMYGYLKSQETPSSNPLDSIDVPSSPCVSKIYATDGPSIQKYISTKKIIDTEKGKFSVMESDGEIYRNMDHKVYHEAAAAPGKRLNNYDEWRKMMDGFVEKIKEHKK